MRTVIDSIVQPKFLPMVIHFHQKAPNVRRGVRLHHKRIIKSDRVSLTQFLILLSSIITIGIICAILIFLEDFSEELGQSIGRVITTWEHHAVQ